MLNLDCLVCRPNRLYATDVFMMSPGLIYSAVAMPLSTADAEGQHRQMQWIEKQPIQTLKRQILMYISFNQLQWVKGSILKTLTQWYILALCGGPIGRGCVRNIFAIFTEGIMKTVAAGGVKGLGFDS